MRKVLRMAIAAVAATAGVAMATVDFAAAQSPAVSVAVPSPGGGGVAGCYQANHTIYGPYWFSFCLNRGRNGTYQVTGGGLNCNGGLDWYDQGGGRVQVDLYRAGCGRGTDWTGDSLSCRAALLQGGGGGGIGGAIAGAIAGGLGVSVPVPGVPAPSYGGLNCTYYPAAGGYSPVSIYASRS